MQSSENIATCNIPEIYAVKPEHFGTHLLAIAALIAAKQSARCAIARSDLTRRGEDLARAGGAGRVLAIAAAAARPRCAIALLDLPRPGGIAWPGRALVASAFALPGPVLCASKVASQLPGTNWVGGAVLAGTIAEPGGNYQPIEFERFVPVVLWFQRGATRIRARCKNLGSLAYMREGSLEPLEPLIFIKQIHRFSGSREVLERFSSRTTRADGLESGGFLRFSNILAAGYWPAGSIEARGSAGSTVLGSRAGETFGVSAGGRRAIGAGGAVQLLDLVPIGLELGRIWPADGNGGFLRVSRLGCGPVGRPMLEGMAQRRGKPRVSGLGRKPVGLARHLDPLALVAIGLDQAAPADRPEAPPCAPIRARRSPAHAGALACRNLDRLRPSIIPGALRGRAGRRQTLSGTIGSGFGNAPGQFAAAMGRGEGAGGMSGKLIGLRRERHVTRGMIRVN